MFSSFLHPYCHHSNWGYSLRLAAVDDWNIHGLVRNMLGTQARNDKPSQYIHYDHWTVHTLVGLCGDQISPTTGWGCRLRDGLWRKFLKLLCSQHKLHHVLVIAATLKPIVCLKLPVFIVIIDNRFPFKRLGKGSHFNHIIYILTHFSQLTFVFHYHLLKNFHWSFQVLRLCDLVKWHFLLFKFQLERPHIYYFGIGIGCRN